MTADPDEEALAWAGDSESGRGGADKTAGEAAAPKPRVKVIVDEAPKPRTSSLLLVTYGILAGAYLIYTLGWVVAVQRLGASVVGVLAQLMFGLGEILAIASPAIWFAAVFLLTRGSKPLLRLVWLLVGLAVVIPWGFLLVRAAA
jgi:hypothetical protein